MSSAALHDDKHSSRDNSKPSTASTSANANANQPDDDELEEAKSDEGSDPVMVSPSTSPQRIGSPVPGLVKEDDDDDQEQFEDSLQADEPLLEAATTTTTAVMIPPPPSFVSVGLARKASPLRFKSWMACALTLDGRDKITKVLQYVSRLLAWWYSAHRLDANQSARFTGLFKALATSRKAFRLGRSFMEMDKIQSMGLLSMLAWHLHRHLERLEGKTEEEIELEEHDGEHPRPKVLVRRASSNIGWGPMAVEDMDDATTRPSLTRSLSNIAYRRMYRPLLSKMSSTLGGGEATTSPTVEWWMAVGSALKMVGLLGFWLGDNINFVTGSGALDNYRLDRPARLARRQQWQTFASKNANRAYFMGSMAGLVTNAYAYYRFCKDKMGQATKEYQEAAATAAAAAAHQLSDDDNNVETDEQSHALRRLKRLQEKKFSLFLALLKSLVDVTVFSNNAGIDLHMKLRGKKNHEGLHCLCGLISASTVLYNNFPEAGAIKK